MGITRKQLKDKKKEVSLKGVDELYEMIEASIRLYPDIASDELEKTARKYRRRVIDVTKTKVKVNGERSGLIKGYKLDKLRGTGMYLEKDFRATAKHFHLIEHGHEIVLPRTRNGVPTENGGARVGFVKGKKILKDVNEEWDQEIKKAMENVVLKVWKIENR